MHVVFSSSDSSISMSYNLVRDTTLDTHITPSTAPMIVTLTRHNSDDDLWSAPTLSYSNTNILWEVQTPLSSPLILPDLINNTTCSTTTSPPLYSTKMTTTNESRRI